LTEFGDAAGLGFMPDAYTYVQMIWIWIWCGSGSDAFYAAGLVEDPLVGVQSKEVRAPLLKIYRQFLGVSQIKQQHSRKKAALDCTGKKVPRVLMPSLRG
jgi:hypothetical protein